MRLDHISYVTTHNQLADTVQRLGSRLGCTFVDGGIHPRFGTRNFTSALKNHQYLEVVCPLGHPSTELTPWGKAVSAKAEEGGGWFTWVFSTDDIEPIEIKFGRSSAEGHRTRPDGSDLKWKQIGVNEITESRALPFFIQWLSDDHPSRDGKPLAEIKKIVIAAENKLKDSWFEDDIKTSLGNVGIEWISSSSEEEQFGIVSVQFETPSGFVILE